jgi:serine protease
LTQLILNLKNDPEIDYVERIPQRLCIATPNDPSITTQWSLTKVKAYDAWNINPGNQIIKIAVVDNAIQVNHVDLQANMLTGYDVADNDTNPNPPNDTFNHGTHVAGIIGAVSNNNIGIASVGNNKIKIIPVKVTRDLGGSRSIDYGYEGITWAADNGANIINCSWGGNGYTQTEKLVIDYAISKGCVIVAAAGNDNTETELYPAAYPGVISVSSTDTDDKKSSFSSYGTWVDIAAPGRGILSSIPTDLYSNFSGTSMASPLVAACLGFIWSCKPTLTAVQLEALLKATSDNIDIENPNYKGKLGIGRVNLLKAISCQEINQLEANIVANGSTHICSGESVSLNSNGNAIQSFDWFKNGINLGLNQTAITVNSEGEYRLRINQGTCSINSKSKFITINTIKSSNPIITNKSIPYCSTILNDKTLIAVAPNCNLKGPKSYNYLGGTVGYDNLESSGLNPSILINDLGGVVSNIIVSISWQKKDQGLFNSCDLTDQGSVPYNEEVSFKIKSPTGKIINLINPGTFAKGTSTSGIVTTIFQEGAALIPQGSLPTSGTFGPIESLNGFLNEIPFGIWELLPADDSFGDPLCVSGFSLTITTNIINSAPNLTWWDSPVGGNVLFTGSNFTPNIVNIGKYNYYVQNLCEGGCMSERVANQIEIKSVPEIKATKVPPIINPTGTYNSPNLTSPITICDSDSYVLTALGCGSSTVLWSNGIVNDWIQTQTGTYSSYTANCQSLAGGCPIIQSNPFLFLNPLTANTEIIQNISANSTQTFVELNLKASNKIATPATIEYRGIKSIELKPGFEVSANSVFKAEIKGCSN